MTMTTRGAAAAAASAGRHDSPARHPLMRRRSCLALVALWIIALLVCASTAAAAAAAAPDSKPSSLRARGGDDSAVQHQPRQLQTTAGEGNGTAPGPTPSPPTTATTNSSSGASPTRAPTTAVPVTRAPTFVPEPTPAPTVLVTESPTPLPTRPPPIDVTMVISLILSFPEGPSDVNYKTFQNQPAAQNAVKDTLTLAIVAIKRPDIDNITAIKGNGRLTELRLRVRLNTVLQPAGPYATPEKYYEALRVQFRNTYGDGSLNRVLQSSAVANNVDAFVKCEVKSYTLPTSYLVNNMTVSVVDNLNVNPDGPSGVPVAIVVSSIVSAVVIFVGMVLFTRQRLATFEIPSQGDGELTRALAPNGEGTTARR